MRVVPLEPRRIMVAVGAELLGRRIVRASVDLVFRARLPDQSLIMEVEARQERMARFPWQEA